MSDKLDLETLPGMRQRRTVNTLEPTTTSSAELTQEEIERAMDAPITKKDILSLLAVVVPIALLIMLQGNFFGKRGPEYQEPNLFLDFLADLRS